MSIVLVEAPSYATLLRTEVVPRQSRLLGDAGATDGRWVTMTDLLADDAALLRDAHGRLVAAGSAPQAAAKHLVGWVAGWLARTVALVHATTGAGVLADGSVRWRLLPGGWPDRVDVASCAVLVPAGHRWAGQPGVRSAPPGDPGDAEGSAEARLVPVARACTAALVATLTPYVAACQGLAKVGRTALWAEVADALGDATSGDPALEARGSTIPALRGLLAAPGAPWRQTPRLWCATGQSGPRVVCQRGGCCLAYLYQPPNSTEPSEPSGPSGRTEHAGHVDEDEAPDAPETLEVEADPPAAERAYAAFVARFPAQEGAPGYCTGCRFRDPEDVQARQLFWCDRLAAERDSDARRRAWRALLDAGPAAARLRMPGDRGDRES